MILSEIFVKLGLDVDAQSFAKGQLAADALKLALSKMVDVAKGAAAFLKDSTLGVLEQADALGKQAQKIGINAQAFQEIAYAADMAGVSTEELGQSMLILNRNVLAAREGNKDMRAEFKKLGITLDDSAGYAKSTETLFGELAARFEKMPESAARSAIAMKFFGKSGATLIPMVKGLAGMREEFRQLGGGFSDDLIARSEEVNDNISRMGYMWKGVKVTIAEAVLPALEEVVGETLDWAKANKDVIKEELRAWISGTIKVAREWVAAVREWIAEQGGLAVVIGKVATALKLLLTYMAVRTVISFAQSIVGLGSAVKGLWVALAANPLGALLSLLAILVTTVIANWDDIKLAFKWGYQWISETLDAIGEGLAEFGSALYAVFVQPWVDAFTAIYDAAKKTFDWIGEKLDWVGDKMNAVGEYFGGGSGETSGVRGIGAEGMASIAAAQSRANALAPSVPRLDAPARVANRVVNLGAPVFNVTQLPGENGADFSKRVASEVDRHNRAALRDAKAGVL